MPSPTQRQLTLDDVRTAARTGFGPDTEVSAAEQLSGGSFGSVWRVDLADGRRVVLKSAPESSAKLLIYEAGMLAEEANYLRLAAPVAGAPTADLLFVNDEYLFMSFLPGVPLADLPDALDTADIRAQCGAAIARLHGVTGDRFGYHGARPHASNWPDAFAAMMEAIFEDAEVWDVQLPVPPAAVRSSLATNHALLAAITTPRLLHFDLWDGNVLVDAGALSGLVDGERYLVGDPLLDFASPALFQDMLADPDHPFARGYAQVRPLKIDDGVRRRLWLYQLYLYLLMVVEYPSRGMRPEDDPARWELLAHLVRSRIELLR
jgi:fructosamine-3-kinase